MCVCVCVYVFVCVYVCVGGCACVGVCGYVCVYMGVCVWCVGGREGEGVGNRKSGYRSERHSVGATPFKCTTAGDTYIRFSPHV